MPTLSKPLREPFWRIEQRDRVLVIIPCGAWILRSLVANPPPDPVTLNLEHTSSVILDGSWLEALDTAGAKHLYDQLAYLHPAIESILPERFTAKHVRVLSLVRNRIISAAPLTPPSRPKAAIRFADWMLAALQQGAGHLSFFGEVLANIAATFLRPQLLRMSDLVIQLQRSALEAIPIVCLVTFLIGLVMAYLFTSQAAKFGATIFVVDAVSIGMCRELSPVLTAIIVAGRSGSAFTAQLGTMKMAQEVDAIRVMGFSPLQVLVLPRILALTVAMPLLVFAGDVFGILGGFSISNTSLDISWGTFTSRMQSVLQVKHVYVGLGKAPLFAIVVGLISCRSGLTVQNNAQSVGLNTTATVVQSVVAVILMDAAFAVMLQDLGW